MRREGKNKRRSDRNRGRQSALFLSGVFRRRLGELLMEENVEIGGR